MLLPTPPRSPRFATGALLHHARNGTGSAGVVRPALIGDAEPRTTIAFAARRGFIVSHELPFIVAALGMPPAVQTCRRFKPTIRRRHLRAGLLVLPPA